MDLGKVLAHQKEARAKLALISLELKFHIAQS
jgi:hypothetical protein